MWDKASDEALSSYSHLTHKLCNISLNQFYSGEINGIELYNKLIENLENAAHSCIPKYDQTKTKKKHNIPLW